MAEDGSGHPALAPASPGRPDGACQRSCATAAWRPRRSVFRAVNRGLIVVGVAVTGSVATVLLTAVPGYQRSRRGMAALQWFSRLMLRAMGIVVVSGGSQRSGPSLVVANHVSWLDVLVLAAAGPVLPVAKAEVAQWPLLGGLAARIGTVFIARERWRELPAAVEQMTAALRRGVRLQVFPEGTTRCGSALNPFHRAAFQAAVDAAVVVSPVALRYFDRAERSRSGRLGTGAGSGGAVPGGGRPTSVAAFVGDDDLLASIWRILRAGPLMARVDWLPIIPAHVDGGHPARNRARIALRAERAVAMALGQPVTGRTSVTRPVPAAHRQMSVLLPLPWVPGPRPAAEGTPRGA